MPNREMTTAKSSLSLVTMSAAVREDMSEREQVCTCGARTEAKSVKCRHMHCVTPPPPCTQPAPSKLCSTLDQAQLKVLFCQSAQPTPE